MSWLGINRVVSIYPNQSASIGSSKMWRSRWREGACPSPLYNSCIFFNIFGKGFAAGLVAEARGTVSSILNDLGGTEYGLICFPAHQADAGKAARCKEGVEDKPLQAGLDSIMTRAQVILAICLPSCTFCITVHQDFSCRITFLTLKWVSTTGHCSDTVVCSKN